MKIFFTMNRTKDIFLSIVLSLFIISFAVICIVFCKYIYYFDISYLNIDGITGLSQSVIRENYDSLIAYQSIFYQGPLILPNFVMSMQGRIHFEEVKKIFECIQYACIVFGGISLPMVIHNLKQKEYRFLRLTGIITLLIPLIIVFFVAIDFDQAFILFHRIVFKNNYWIFDPMYDPVITILPEAFFMHSFVGIVVIIVVISIGMMWLYKKISKKIIESEI